jgi:hypothetical protein
MPIDPTKVNVIYNDGNGNSLVVPQNQNNSTTGDGWSYDNPSTPSAITLDGQSCATMKSNPKGSISIVVGCKTQVH